MKKIYYLYDCSQGANIYQCPERNPQRKRESFGGWGLFIDLLRQLILLAIISRYMNPLYLLACLALPDRHIIIVLTYVLTKGETTNGELPWNVVNVPYMERMSRICAVEPMKEPSMKAFNLSSSFKAY